MFKTKHTLKLFCTILALLMTFCSASLSVQANDKEITPYFSTIASASSAIRISGIKATCSATLTSNRSVSLKIKMELQKKKSSGYETVETWTASRTGSILTDEESRNINILYDYRLKTTFTAGSESFFCYSYPS